ncbi:hypothetical protein L7F22_063978 [Adiantum nelumboides]|nr:hypothetical protein [Adiantum nelumboides]
MLTFSSHLPPSPAPAMTNTAAKIMASASKALKLGMIPADGIGREVLPCAARVLQATPGAPKIEFINLLAGFEHFQKHGTALPEETIRALKEECDGAMFGSVSSPSHKVEGYSSPIVKLRKELDLYANIRPVVGVSGTRDDDKWVDTVIVRENTECLYIKSETIEDTPQGQVARAIRQITEKASTRIGRKAFDVALAREQLRTKAGVAAARGKAKVTVCHKSNVLSVTDGLFRTSVRAVYEKDQVAAGGPGRYAGIDMDEQLVDSMVYTASSASRTSLMSLLHPTCMVTSSPMVLLPWWVRWACGTAARVHGESGCVEGSVAHAERAATSQGLLEPALKIYRAVDEVIREGRALTPDLRGTATTTECQDAIIKALTK